MPDVQLIRDIFTKTPIPDLEFQKEQKKQDVPKRPPPPKPKKTQTDILSQLRAYQDPSMVGQGPQKGKIQPEIQPQFYNNNDDDNNFDEDY